MEYAIVVEAVDSGTDITAWVLTRESEGSLDLAVPFSTVSAALGAVDGGALGLHQDATDHFVERVESGGRFPNEDMTRAPYGVVGDFPWLMWLPLR